ncbi:MAG: hypothetical protein MUO19_03225 [Dehalococcoidales bacterium]|nr:hypothetical protein [Dehalococcoidales bacterium]
MNFTRGLAYLVLVLGLVAIVVGGVFIGLGASKANLLTDAMQTEQITLGIESDSIEEGELIDSAAEAELAGDTIREHRHGIAPSYGDLLGTGRYDPTNPTQLTYAQAMNLENYLYLAVLGFGVTQLAMGAGAFMIITGIALGAAGWALARATKA